MTRQSPSSKGSPRKKRSAKQKSFKNAIYAEFYGGPYDGQTFFVAKPAPQKYVLPAPMEIRLEQWREQHPDVPHELLLLTVEYRLRVSYGYVCHYDYDGPGRRDR